MKSASIRYQGRIDDQFGFDFRRKEPTRHDLAEALNEVLAGKKVTVASARRCRLHHRSGAPDPRVMVLLPTPSTLCR